MYLKNLIYSNFNKINIFIKYLSHQEEQVVKSFAAFLNNEFCPTNSYHFYPCYIEDSALKENESFDLQQKEDGILWAVPKNRRSVEKRRSRRIGAVDYVCKLHPIKKLLTCLVCGSAYEHGRLCPVCFEKVMKVSEKIKQSMKEAEGEEPIERDCVVLFKGEHVKSEDGFYQGKRIVEVPEERPSWFGKNLMQKSNVALSDETVPSIPDPLHIKIE